MNDNSYQKQFKWTINKNQLNQIINNNNCNSNAFQIGTTMWKLNASRSPQGLFVISAQLLSMNKQWKNIVVSLQIICAELGKKYTKIRTYSTNSIYDWANTLSISRVINYNKPLTFIVNILILHINYHNGKGSKVTHQTAPLKKMNKLFGN